MDYPRASHTAHVEKMPQIAQATQRLDESTANLAQIIDRLTSRLSAVCRQEPTKSNEVAPVRDGFSTPLAENLGMMAARVESAAQSLNDILNLLEI